MLRIPGSVVTAALAAILTTAGAASATVMVRASVEELAAESDLVLIGVVESVEATDRGPRPGIFTRVVVAVDEPLRGSPGASRVRFWTPGGRVGDRAMRTHGAAEFTPGERVVVFLMDAGGALFPTALSQGKWRVRGDEAWSSAPSSALVARHGDGLRPAPPPPAISLDELRARVRSVR